MKRVRRILLNTLTAISLLLAIAWYRSPSVADAVWLQAPAGISATVVSRQHWVMISIGQLSGIVQSMDLRTGVFFHTFEPNGFGTELTEQQGGTLFSHLGLVSANTEIPTAHLDGGFSPYQTGMEFVHALYVPHALAIPIVGWYPVRRAIGWWKERKRANRTGTGHCPACSYDMRANPAKCSECGREATCARTGHE